jgi:hypothetical protein
VGRSKRAAHLNFKLGLMKLALRIIVFTLLVGFSFIAGRFYDELSNFWQKPVSVKITNESEQPVKSITISYSGYKTEGTIKVEPQTSEKALTIRFYQTGEGSFTIEAVLENGKVLRNTEGYIEAGYSFNKVLTPTEIKNK